MSPQPHSTVFKTADNVADRAVGAQIRHLRQARGLSLRQVAAKAGLSVGLLSQVERGVSSAPVRVLALLADELDVAVADLFGTGDRTAGHIVTRLHERGVTLGPPGITKELLTVHGERRGLDLFFIHLGRGDSSGDAYGDSGIEAGYVVAGGLELEVDGHIHLLGEGDSCGFASPRQHRFRNAGRRPTKVLWAKYRKEASSSRIPDAADSLDTSTSTENLP